MQLSGGPADRVIERIAAAPLTASPEGIVINNERSTSGQSLSGGDVQATIVADPDPPGPRDAADPLSSQDDSSLWMRLGLSCLPDGSGYTCVGRRFILTINSDLDVEFEFDADPSTSGQEGSDLRAGLIALVLLVRNITVRNGAVPSAGSRAGEVAAEHRFPAGEPTPEMPP